jgi:hypothetical protein
VRESTGRRAATEAPVGTGAEIEFVRAKRRDVATRKTEDTTVPKASRLYRHITATAKDFDVFETTERTGWIDLLNRIDIELLIKKL